VYRVAKARGMDIVTITDHDSIGGCLEFLNRHPDAQDFFISEEIECWVPGRALKLHIGAYDIDERIHREIQPLRKDVVDLCAYLREQRVFFVFNHPFFFLNRQMSFAEYAEHLLPLFDAVEVRNGAMIEAHNTLVETIVGERKRSGTCLSAIGGSDAHTLAAIGTTFTETPGTTRAEFLSNLRAGRTTVGGRHGGTVRVMREIYGVVFRYWLSLLGVGRQELSSSRRAIGLAFSALSMPLEFIPALIAAIDKAGERRRIVRFANEWTSLLPGSGSADAASSPRRERRFGLESGDELSAALDGRVAAQSPRAGQAAS
jgi:predicted metal-dependent phosphoesterase TrpH